ncbi:protein kinase domain-containing protein [Actinosynnema sp. NPDC004786]
MWDGELTGELVDERYALGDLYGTGGMAEVYRAVDTRLDRKVAIKFFQGGDSGEDRIRLDREARVLGGLRCPGLVEVYGTGTFRGRPYFVMQAVEGGTLRRRMRGAMSPEVVASVGAQIAEVLAHVHANDVVHRDVKPSNILLDTAGRRAYLADFGLALQGQVTRVTRSGVLVGTAGYLAPEQVRGGDVQPSVDVYALGLVLLECLTGRPEYPGGDTEAALARLHRAPRVPATLPAPWVEVLTAMTATDPAARPSAAESAELLAQARRASAGLPPLAEAAEAGAASGAADRDAVAAGSEEPGNRAMLVGAGAAAVVLTLIGFLVFGDRTATEPGERAGRSATSTAAAPDGPADPADPVAEQASRTGVVLPGQPPASTVTVVEGAPAQQPQQPQAGPTGGTSHGTTEARPVEGFPTTVVTEPPPGTPVRQPPTTPVVVIPDPGPPTDIGPPTGKRGPPTRQG